MATDHYTKIADEGRFVQDGPDAAEEARKLHHLATADPDPGRADGMLTGPAHEEKYGLERAKGSAAAWRGVGVHPTENRGLVGDEDGAENVRGASPKIETTAAPRASSKDA